jgi:Phosphodiester glycosidase
VRARLGFSSFLLALLALPVAPRAASEIVPEWRALAAGLSYAVMTLDESPSWGDGKLHVVRIDPELASLRAEMASEHDGRSRTASDWCDDRDLAVAINMGMYQTDYSSNVGYARDGAHLNQPRLVSKYKSVLAFGARKSGVPQAVMIDLDEPGAEARLDDYATVIQNLRLIKAPGKNVWSKQERRWSEAAIAMDRDGRILFLFTRTPYAMWELNRSLLKLPLGIVRAMHVEGGPEASLSIHAGGLRLDLNGSFETGFVSDDAQASQWPIPNVIGITAAR